MGIWKLKLNTLILNQERNTIETCADFRDDFSNSAAIWWSWSVFILLRTHLLRFYVSNTRIRITGGFSLGNWLRIRRFLDRLFLNSLLRYKITTGPSPHFRGYRSRSIITRFILATIPWSHVAIVAVDIKAIPKIRNYLIDIKF